MTIRELQAELQEILDVNLADDVLAWAFGPRRRWTTGAPRPTGVDTHLRLQELADRDAVKPTEAAVRASGGVVVRDGANGPEVLLVHRPKLRRLVLPEGQARTG